MLVSFEGQKTLFIKSGLGQRILADLNYDVLPVVTIIILENNV